MIRAVAVVTALVSLCLVSVAGTALAAPPHVTNEVDTASCALCHRTHTSASTITVDPQDAAEVKNALIVGSFEGEAADTQLCFSCHDGLGSVYDTYTEFQSVSAHSLAPTASPYGPSPKGCYSCHDSHGSTREASGTPYPALLESKGASGTYYRSGDQYCSACHIVRSGNEFPGLAVWQQTAHSRALARSDGTKITCSICHEPHGSSNAALVVQRLTPPSAPDTVAVPANDRWLCYGCHADALATYAGGLVHQGSSHGLSTQTVPVDAEWASRLASPSADATRQVGECQTCHAPMGVDDGTGTPVPNWSRPMGPRCATAATALDRRWQRTWRPCTPRRAPQCSRWLPRTEGPPISSSSGSRRLHSAERDRDDANGPSSCA